MTVFGLFSLLLLVLDVGGLDNGLARTPPMGWLSWERFRCIVDCENYPDSCISENLYKAMADRMVADGYKDVGYEYINIDDCWMSKERDANGRLQADPKRFPNGIRALADYVHSKGLKLGIYEDFGKTTCGGYPGSEFYMPLDAQTFADWQIDMLKLDGCNSATSDMPYGYPIMEKFLKHAGRPILYSCEWPLYYNKKPNYTAIAESCNIWRNFHDIQDSWVSVSSIINFYGANEQNFSQIARPGQFNDPDMLIVGDFGLSYDQQRTQMGMWAIMASPLFMSVDLRKIPEESKALLQNRHVLAINQDPMGVQGLRKWMVSNLSLWTKPILPKGSFAFALVNFNTGGTPLMVKTTLKDMGLTDEVGYNVTEAFEGKFLGIFKPSSLLNTTVNPTGIFLATATPLSSFMGNL